MLDYHLSTSWGGVKPLASQAAPLKQHLSRSCSPVSTILDTLHQCTSVAFTSWYKMTVVMHLSPRNEHENMHLSNGKCSKSRSCFLYSCTDQSARNAVKIDADMDTNDGIFILHWVHEYMDACFCHMHVKRETQKCRLKQAGVRECNAK